MQDNKSKANNRAITTPVFDYRMCYFAVILLTAGVVLTILSGILGEDALSPGKISSAHSTVESCGQCHASMENGFESMVSTLIDNETPISNSKLCINCHAFGETAFDPHGLTTKTLQKFAKKRDQDKEVTLSSEQSPLMMHAAKYINTYANEEQVPCTVCHKEHKGSISADIVNKKSDEFCQSCHNSQFEGFAQGHPEFAHYPYQQTPNFKFSHGEHFVKHFTDEKYQDNAKQTCSDCHIVGQNKKIGLASFDDTCADCHSKRIQGDGSNKNSVPFIAIPGLDIETLIDANVDIGYWPEYAEAELTPFMHLLLLADQRYQAISDELNDVDLLDLSDEEDHVIAAAGELAWAVKRLIHSLAITEGVLGMAKQFEGVFGRTLTAAEKVNLSALLSSDSLKASMESWFPTLTTEIDAYKLGNSVATTVEVEEQQLKDNTNLPRVEGWYRSGYTLYYKLTGHNDSFVKAWLDFTVNHPVGLSLGVEKILSVLSDKKSPGGCLKCHGISRDGNKSRKIQWTANMGDFENILTTFNHQPHFSSMGNKECSVCHQVEKKEDKVNFKPLVKEVCTDCHNSTDVSQTCTTCHKYHGSNAVHKTKAKL